MVKSFKSRQVDFQATSIIIKLVLLTLVTYFSFAIASWSVTFSTKYVKIFINFWSNLSFVKEANNQIYNLTAYLLLAAVLTSFGIIVLATLSGLVLNIIGRLLSKISRNSSSGFLLALRSALGFEVEEGRSPATSVFPEGTNQSWWERLFESFTATSSTHRHLVNFRLEPARPIVTSFIEGTFFGVVACGVIYGIIWIFASLGLSQGTQFVINPYLRFDLNLGTSLFYIQWFTTALADIIVCLGLITSLSSRLFNPFIGVIMGSLVYANSQVHISSDLISIIPFVNFMLLFTILFTLFKWKRSIWASLGFLAIFYMFVYVIIRVSDKVDFNFYNLKFDHSSYSLLTGGNNGFFASIIITLVFGYFGVKVYREAWKRSFGKVGSYKLNPQTKQTQLSLVNSRIATIAYPLTDALGSRASLEGYFGLSQKTSQAERKQLEKDLFYTNLRTNQEFGRRSLKAQTEEAQINKDLRDLSQTYAAYQASRSEADLELAELEQELKASKGETLVTEIVTESGDFEDASVFKFGKDKSSSDSTAGQASKPADSADSEELDPLEIIYQASKETIARANQTSSSAQTSDKTPAGKASQIAQEQESSLSNLADSFLKYIDLETKETARQAEAEMQAAQQAQEQAEAEQQRKAQAEAQAAQQAQQAQANPFYKT